MTESVRDTYGTPLWMVGLLEARLGGPFDLDVAAAPHNAKAQRFYTRADNALELPWVCARALCNPPFSQLLDFVLVGIRAVRRGEIEVGVGVRDPRRREHALLGRARGRWRAPGEAARSVVVRCAAGCGYEHGAHADDCMDARAAAHGCKGAAPVWA